MSAAPDPLEAPARHGALSAVGLGGPALDRALDVACEGPDARAWATILDRTLLVAGALLAIGAGACVLAWTWADLRALGAAGIAIAAAAGAASAALARDLLSPPTLRDVRARLASEGVSVPPEETWAAAAGRARRPGLASALAGLAGWVVAAGAGAALAAALPRGGNALAVVGLAVCAGAAAARPRARGAFATQALLAASLAGQAMVAARVVGGPPWSDGIGPIPLVAIASFEAILVVVFADPVHRTLSTVAAAAFLRAALERANVGTWSPAVFGAALLFVWAAPGHAFRPPVAASLRRPLGIGLAIAFVGAYLWPLVDVALASPAVAADPARAAAWEAQRNVAAGVAAVALGVAGARALARLRVTLGSRSGTAFLLGGAGLVALGTQAPGVPAALAVMALGVEAREGALFWIGAAAATAFLSWWSYDLAATLPARAAILAAMGAVLLGARFLVGRPAR